MKVQEGKFKLQDLLVVPMQRVLKYHLLLKVGSHTAPDTNAHAPRPHRPRETGTCLFHVYSAFINTPETVILPCFARHLNYD